MGYQETEILRKAGKFLLPEAGGWVMFKGNPHATRGLRIVPALREVGVRHLDIYWAYNELCPWNLPRKGFVKDYVDFRAEPDEIILEMNEIGPEQLTWLTLHTPASQLVRAWCGEVAKISDGVIQELLATGNIEPVTFATKNPVWDEATRDIIGGLMLDGLSLQQAQLELVVAGELKADETTKPSHYYRVVRDSDVWNAYCEEPEYEDWYANERNN